MQKSFISCLLGPERVTMAQTALPSCLKSSLFIATLLIFQPLTAQPDLTAMEKELAAKKSLLGKDFVVLVWKNGDSLVYKKEVGEFKSRTVAPIASCSKWLTAAVVMTYVDEGKISLDDKVSKWLPEFERYGKGYITIRHCLSHMTGIEDEGRLLKKILQRKRFASLEEEVNSFAAREIRANAGTDFWYGNIGLNIAARVLEVLTKRKFEALASQRLFRPLGMTRTTFSNPDGSPPNPSGGARSNAEDYLKFLRMMLDKGTYQGRRILSDSSVMLMTDIQTANVPMAYSPEAAKGFHYALGSWAVESQSHKATALASPGLFGTWPMIDYCRGYAYILLVKNYLGEEKAEAHLEIKKSLDAVLESSCK